MAAEAAKMVTGTFNVTCRKKLTIFFGKFHKCLNSESWRVDFILMAIEL